MSGEIIQGVHMRARMLSADWHAEIEKRRDWYNQVHYKGRPKPYEDRYTDPTPTVTVDTAVAVLLSGELSFSALGFSVPNSDETDKVEKMLAGLLQINSEREESNLMYDICLHFVRDGAAVLYTVWDDVLARDVRTGGQPVPTYTEPPIRVQVIDPLKVHLIPGGPNRWSAVVREEQIAIADAEALYGITIDRYADKGLVWKYENTDTLIDMWRIVRKDDRYVVQNGIMYAGQVIKEVTDMEGYDDLPFTIAFFKPVDNSKSAGWGQSILDPLMHTTEHLEKAINRRARQITVYSSLPPTARLSSDRHLNLPNIIGQPIKLGPNEEFGFPTWPGNAPDVDRHIAFLSDRLRMTGFVEAFYGIGGEGMSGYALSRISDANKLKIAVPTENLEMLFSLWARKALRLLVNFAAGSMVRVYGKLRGRDFVEQIVGEDMANYLVKASYRAKFPGDEVRRHAMATQVRGLLSDATLMEKYLDVEQPGDERRKRLREMAQMHPVMQQYMILSALMEMAMDGDMAAALALQTLTQPPVQQQRQPSPLQAEGGMLGAVNQPTPQEQGMMTAQEEGMIMGTGGGEVAGPLGGRSARPEGFGEEPEI